jgi:hypothetical protein
MTLNVQRLTWDSEFFGFGVGRLIGLIESTAIHHEHWNMPLSEGFNWSIVNAHTRIMYRINVA